MSGRNFKVMTKVRFKEGSSQSYNLLRRKKAYDSVYFIMESHSLSGIDSSNYKLMLFINQYSSNALLILVSSLPDNLLIFI